MKRRNKTILNSDHFYGRLKGHNHILFTSLILVEVPLLDNVFININPIVTHFFAQSQASGTALFWAIHM